MVYGNFTTLTFDDINTEEMLVIHLKRKIYMRLKLEAKDQRLSVRLHDDLREMENQNSLSAYLISDKTPIFLENTLLGLQGFQSVATEQELTQTASVVSHYYICRTSKTMRCGCSTTPNTWLELEFFRTRTPKTKRT